MYRIIKRIVHTVTTVIWLVRLEDHSEKEITFPSSYSVTEEDVQITKDSLESNLPFKSTLDKGEHLMSTLQEQNKQLVHRFFEAGINQNEQSVFDELIAPNYVNHNMPAPAPGPDGLRQVVGMFKAGFPDLRAVVEASIAEDDRVATRGYMTGTHAGSFMNIPATGKSIKVTYVDVWRIENGRAVENWVEMDMLGLMQQLGVLPVPG